MAKKGIRLAAHPSSKGEKKAAGPALRVFNWLSMQAARFCATEDGRYSLGTVCFRGRQTVATDGRQLVVIDAPNVQDYVKHIRTKVALDVPDADKVEASVKKNGVKIDTDDGQAFMLPVAAVKRLARDLKKRKKGQDHYCLVDSRGAKTKEPRVTCIVGQVDGNHTSELRVVDGKYPNYEQVIPKEKPAVVVELNPEYLGRICKLMQDVCSYGSGWHMSQMTMSVYGPGDAVKIEAKNEGTGQKALAVLMPLEPKEEKK